jgi:hypothetical protein
MRHSFVSLLSASGIRIEDISRLVGHRGSFALALPQPDAGSAYAGVRSSPRHNAVMSLS